MANNRKPSIAPLGESLLAKAKKSSRGDSDDMIKALLLQFGVSLGNSILNKKAGAFLDDSRVKAARMQQRNAITDAENILSTQQKIEASNKSAEEYFADLRRPTVEQGISEAHKEELLNKDAYNTWITKQSRIFGREEALKHSEALSAARNIGTMEEFERSVALKNSRPKNVAKWAARRFTSLFGGKSQKEIDEEAYQEIESGEFGGRAEDLDFFRKAYFKSQNLAASYDYTKAKIRARDFPDEIKETSQIIVEKGEVHHIIIPTITDPKTGNTKAGEARAKKLFVVEESDEDKKKNDRAFMKALSATFHFINDGSKVLRPNAMEMLTKSARDLGINLTDIKTPEQYTQVSEIWTRLHGDVNNLTDPFKDRQAIAILETMGGDMQNIQRIMASISDNDEERLQNYEKLLVEMQAFANLVRSYNTDPRSGGSMYPKSKEDKD